MKEDKPSTTLAKSGGLAVVVFSPQHTVAVAVEQHLMEARISHSLYHRGTTGVYMLGDELIPKSVTDVVDTGGNIDLLVDTIKTTKSGIRTMLYFIADFEAQLLKLVAKQPDGEAEVLFNYEFAEDCQYSFTVRYDEHGGLKVANPLLVPHHQDAVGCLYAATGTDIAHSLIESDDNGERYTLYGTGLPPVINLIPSVTEDAVLH